MMAAGNCFSLFGVNLTREPEVKMLPSGTACVQFSVAWNERRKEGNEWKDRPHYFECKVWASEAQYRAIKPSLKKGVKVSITGRITQERWEQDGNNRQKVVLLIDDPINGVQVSARATQSGSAAISAGSRANAQDAYSDEDIPF